MRDDDVRHAPLQEMQATQIERVVKQAKSAEGALLEEYAALASSWEKNPTMAACKEGIIAIRSLLKLVEGAK